MWVADARVICAVWGCARCLFGLSVCLRVCLASRCVSGRAWPLCVCSADCTRAHPSCYVYAVCSPVCEWYHPSLELPHIRTPLFVPYVVYPGFICLRFFIAFCHFVF